MKEIEPHEVFHQGQWRTRVIVPRALNSGRSARRYFSGPHRKKLAQRFADGLNGLRQSATGRFLGLPQRHQIALLHAADALGPRLDELGGIIRRHLARKQAQDVPLATVVGECLAEKSKANLSKRYLQAIRCTLENFSADGREALMIGDLTTAHITEFLDRLPAAASRRTQLIDIKTLFAYAERRGYIEENVARLVPLPKVDEMEPGILTVPQVKQLLKTVREEHPKIMRYIALALFAGVRPEEARRLSEKMVTHDYIEVPGWIAKGSRKKKGKRRLVASNDTFRAWWALGGDLPISGWQTRKVWKLVKPWPHDALRHSFVSYHSALYGEVATSTAAGHSIAIMKQHYKATVTTEAAREFWALRP